MPSLARRRGFFDRAERFERDGCWPFVTAFERLEFPPHGRGFAAAVRAAGLEARTPGLESAHREADGTRRADRVRDALGVDPPPLRTGARETAQRSRIGYGRDEFVRLAQRGYQYARIARMIGIRHEVAISSAIKLRRDGVEIPAPSREEQVSPES